MVQDHDVRVIGWLSLWRPLVVDWNGDRLNPFQNLDVSVSRSALKNLPPQLLMILEEAGHLHNLPGKKRSQNHDFDSFLLMLSIGLNLAGNEPLIFQIQSLTIFESNPRPKGRF